MLTFKVLNKKILRHCSNSLLSRASAGLVASLFTFCNTMTEVGAQVAQWQDSQDVLASASYSFYSVYQLISVVLIICAVINMFCGRVKACIQSFLGALLFYLLKPSLAILIGFLLDKGRTSNNLAVYSAGTMVLLSLVVLLALWQLPTIVAFVRKAANRWYILGLVLVASALFGGAALGGTSPLRTAPAAVLYIVALTWAFGGRRKKAQSDDPAKRTQSPSSTQPTVEVTRELAIAQLGQPINTLICDIAQLIVLVAEQQNNDETSSGG